MEKPIYLDYNATTPVDPEVVKEMTTDEDIDFAVEVITNAVKKLSL